MKKYLFFTFVVFLFFACENTKNTSELKDYQVELIPDAYNVGFLIMDGVYNTELTAPYDIFQHTKYREGIKPMNVFTVSQSLDVVTSFEGLRILPDFMFSSSAIPHIDILVVPSAEHHLDSDLENKEMIDWVTEISKKATFVTSHCDGAFVLAQAGLLNEVASTTFPSDIPQYKKMFPALEVISDVFFVHDGKYITSAGGAKSFEASLYLCEHLYGKEIAQKLAGGLVIDWDLTTVPNLIK